MPFVRAMIFALALLAVWGAVRGWPSRHGAIAHVHGPAQDASRA